MLSKYRSEQRVLLIRQGAFVRMVDRADPGNLAQVDAGDIYQVVLNAVGNHGNRSRSGWEARSMSATISAGPIQQQATLKTSDTSLPHHLGHVLGDQAEMPLSLYQCQKRFFFK